MEPGRQWQQLPMFQTPRELRGTGMSFGDMAQTFKTGDTAASANEKLRSLKVDQSKRPGSAHIWPKGEGLAPSLHDSIKAGGVSRPLEVSHFGDRGSMLTDGHHRFFSAEDVAPDRLLPVSHEDFEMNHRPFRRSWASGGK